MVLKDITEEVFSTVFNDPEEFKKRRHFKGATEQDFEMPEDVYKKLANLTKYYEVDNLKDIENEWQEISKQHQIPLSALTWMVKQIMEQGKENPQLMNNMKKHNETVKKDFDELLGKDELAPKKLGLLGKLSGKYDLPKIPSCSLYLNAVSLEKTKTIENNSFIGAEYLITDTRGNTIKAIHIRESSMHQMFDNQKSPLNETREKIDMMRLDPRPSIVVCQPLPTKTPKLNIIRIQSGGKTIAPEMPTIRM
jgi:hypothetical protein